jgi:hypothetical protein
MTSTFEHIQTITLTSAQQKIQFTNLPQTYTDLVFYATLNSAAPSGQVDHTFCRFGNSTYNATNYNIVAMFGRGTDNILEGGAAFTQDQVRLHHYTFIPRLDNEFSMSVLYLFNYTNTSIAKSFQLTSGSVGSANSYAGIETQNGFHTSTSAINQIEFGMWQYTYNLDAGSEISVYGIKKE